MAVSVCDDPLGLSDIEPWSNTFPQYLALERMPLLRTAREKMSDALTDIEREKLQDLIRRRSVELCLDQHDALELHKTVSLLSGVSIARLAVDAIVNAANPLLTTGKGVSGAIHSAAGPQLAEECHTIGGCAVGHAVITGGYNLPCKRILHTVGPHGRDPNKVELLRSCYTSCLDLCKSNGIQSIAFCCISTGVYGYPNVEACDVALSTVRGWLLNSNSPLPHDIVRVIFVVRRTSDEEAYSRLMQVYFPVEIS